MKHKTTRLQTINTAKRKLKKLESKINLKDVRLGLTAREYNERVKLKAFIKNKGNV